MGDRTPFQLKIATCPSEHVNAVLDVIEEYGLQPEDVDPYVVGFDPYAKHTELRLDVWYRDDETTCGSAGMISDRLEELDGVSYLLWEDPAYQWLGDLYLRTPDGTTFTALCESDGTPVFDAGGILSWLATADADGVHDPVALRGYIARRTGKPQLEAMDAAFKATAGQTLPRVTNPCRECGEQADDGDHGLCASCLHNALRSGWTPDGED